MQIALLIFMILNTLGMNSTEILASVGILGMIVGLGAESIVADIVAGFFIIIERLYDVGDIIGVLEPKTGISTIQEVVKKIIKIDNDDVSIEYEVK